MLKTCIKCQQEKDENEFYWENKSANKRKNQCKPCLYTRKFPDGRPNVTDNPEYRRSRHLKWKFGLSTDSYNDMLEEQENKCAICSSTDALTPNNNFCVDHCHNTGKVRALLCSHCNRGLGLFKDNSETLIKAAEYLRKFN